MTYLLPDGTNRYKANLHCHSTLSDGRMTPEALKDAYIGEGYSIIAFTDHDRYYDHSDLCDDKFLAINSFEADISDWAVDSGSYRRCYHLNAYHKTQAKALSVPPVPPYRDIDAINEYIEKLKSMGFLVAYNHPYWSLQSLDDYRNLKGVFAMEIFNYSASIDGTDGDMIQAYTEMLRMGNRLYCTMTDDNHDAVPVGKPGNDSFGGFCVIFAKSLEYSEVIRALEQGSFYCSQGPAFEELTYEDGTVYVKCSPAKRIAFRTLGRRGETLFSEKEGFLTQASFKTQRDDVLVRVEITDETGKKANTNAYFLDTIK